MLLEAGSYGEALDPGLRDVDVECGSDSKCIGGELDDAHDLAGESRLQPPTPASESERAAMLSTIPVKRSRAAPYPSSRRRDPLVELDSAERFPSIQAQPDRLMVLGISRPRASTMNAPQELVPVLVRPEKSSSASTYLSKDLLRMLEPVEPDVDDVAGDVVFPGIDGG